MKLRKQTIITLISVLAVIAIAVVYFISFSGNKDDSNSTSQERRGINNPYGLNGKVYFFAKEGSTTVIFPNDPRIKEIIGRATFINKANKDSFDVAINIPNGKKSEVVKSTQIVKGKWIIKFNWASDNKNYSSIHNIEVK